MRAPLSLRLRVFAARAKLDRQIVGGQSCESSAVLALRASQLTASRTRWEIATAFTEQLTTFTATARAG